MRSANSDSDNHTEHKDIRYIFLTSNPNCKITLKINLSLSLVLIDNYACFDKENLKSDYAYLILEYESFEEENASLKNSLEELTDKGKNKLLLFNKT